MRMNYERSGGRDLHGCRVEFCEEEPDVVKEKVNEIEGLSKNYSEDTHTTEFHADLDIEGFEDMGADGEPTGIKLPYVVTLHKRAEILAIRRNYAENDPLKRKKRFFVHYKFLPGQGSMALDLYICWVG